MLFSLQIENKKVKQMENIKNIDQVEKILEKNRTDIKDKSTFYRFWSKVDIKDNTKDCWNWNANTSTYKYEYEYCKFWFNNTMARTNRVTYKLSKGDIPEDKIVMHLCNNPTCCNPHHLELGSISENSRYMVKCDRWNNYGENNGNSKLTEDNVRDILKIYEVQRKLHPDLKQYQITNQIAQKFEIDETCINRIVNGKSWHKVYKDVYKDLESHNKFNSVQSCYGNTNGSKLTEDDVREIHQTFNAQRAKLKQWQIVEKLTQKFKVGAPHINRILRGDSWHHIYKEFHKEKTLKS